MVKWLLVIVCMTLLLSGCATSGVSHDQQSAVNALAARLNHQWAAGEIKSREQLETMYAPA